jgi:hypothetical protein
MYVSFLGNPQIIAGLRQSQSMATTGCGRFGSFFALLQPTGALPKSGAAKSRLQPRLRFPDVIHHLIVRLGIHVRPEAKGNTFSGFVDTLVVAVVPLFLALLLLNKIAQQGRGVCYHQVNAVIDMKSSGTEPDPLGSNSPPVCLDPAAEDPLDANGAAQSKTWYLSPVRFMVSGIKIWAAYSKARSRDALMSK